MKMNWPKLIFFVIMVSVWAMVMVCVVKMAKDHNKEENKRLREIYSPMSDSPEIQKAYDEIR